RRSRPPADPRGLRGSRTRRRSAFGHLRPHHQGLGAPARWRSAQSHDAPHPEPGGRPAQVARYRRGRGVGRVRHGQRRGRSRAPAPGALVLSRELYGETPLPIGTRYDPFVTRGLDALYHALYSGARFVVAATPSGISLSPEGGAHQSVITPGIGVALPGIVYWDPAFAREVEWILLEGLRGLADGQGEAVYLRLSTRPVDQSLALPPSPAHRAGVLRGAYRLVDARGEPGWDPDTNAVSVFAAG